MLYKDYVLERKESIEELFKKNSLWITKNIDYNNITTIKEIKPYLRYFSSKNHLPDIFKRQLLYLADMSYIPYEFIKRQYKNVSFPLKGITNKNLVRYVMFQEENVITVSFRGTKTWGEMISNLKFYRVPFEGITDEEKDDFFLWRDKILKNDNFDKNFIPLQENKNIEIHKGFQDESFEVFLDLIEKIDKKQQKKMVFNFVGHSLGGVIGTVCSIMIKKYYPDSTVNLITVSSPPCGSKNFNLLLLYYGIHSITRMFNYQDFIPHYGYFGSWIEKKKFRHIDFMLKGGIRAEQENFKSYLNSYSIDKTKIKIYDFGNKLDKWLLENFENLNDLNMKFIVHDIFKIDKKNAIFI